VRFAAGVKVALAFPASSADIPVGFTQGAAQVTVKLAAPVIGAIGSLNAAATALFIPTPVAVLTGATAVTVGATGIETVVNCHV
jgi:hypothetical protein